LPEKYRRTLLLNYFRGDGHFRHVQRDGRYHGYQWGVKTKSEKLQKDIYRMLIQLGALPSIGEYRKGRKHYYTLTLCGTDINVLEHKVFRKSQSSKVVTDSFIAVPIKGITTKYSECDVYNLGVDVDNTYIANNVAVHNCGDAFGTPIVAESVGSVTAVDTEERHIIGNANRLSEIKNITFAKHDICRSPIVDNDDLSLIKFDGAFSIDVIEHLDKELEDSFMINTCLNIVTDGICIIGTPNITANQYSTNRSLIQHINLKSYDSLRKLMRNYFKNVLMFSMNDEVVHTGYGPMAHYLFGVGIGIK
jgi:hypothetical protein